MAHNPFFYDESDIAERVIWNVQNNQNRCSIAKVVSVNASPVSVNIQPLVNYFDLVANWQEYPILEDIPVAQMQTALYSIRTPLNVGDTGLVIWFDREAYTCLLAGAQTPTTPDSGSFSDMNACVFLPIMPSFSAANTLQPTGVDILSGPVGSQISLLTELTNLLTALGVLASAIIAAGTPYAGSPLAPVVGDYPIALTAAAVALQTSITAVTTALTTFKGAQV